MSSFLSVAKNASATALSSAQPLAPIEMSMPAARALWPKISALVAVMHQSGLGPALPDRHLERFDDELGAHVLGHRPAHAAP